MCEHHAYGGAGAAKLGESVISACKQQVDFKFLYDLKQTIKVHCLQWACHSSNASAGVHATLDSMGDMLQKEKKTKDYAFRRQSNEKPRIILGCPRT